MEKLAPTTSHGGLSSDSQTPLRLDAISDHMHRQASQVAALVGQASAASVPQVEALIKAVTEIDELIANVSRGPAGQPVFATITECFAAINTPEGERRLKEYLDSQPFPHYEQDDCAAGTYFQILADGTRTRGHFVDREFRALD